MEHAWLDSLSEDWVSQPGSDTSAAQLPPLKKNERDEPTKSPEHPSRIPRRRLSVRSSLPNTNENSINVLSERSANEINISHRRLPSKLSQELKPAQKETVQRSVSIATNGSVIHNSIQHDDSPTRGHTPEWKRRLVYGDLQYGEQRDLFCSAAAGLQDMFKPPPQVDNGDAFGDRTGQYETTLPSSPPTYPQRIISAELEDGLEILDDDDDMDFPEQITPSPSPRRAQRETRFKPNDEESFLANKDRSRRHRSSNSISQQLDNIYRDSSCLSASSVVDGASRKISGQSDTRNEDFSPILIGRRSDEAGTVDFAPIEIPMDQLKAKLERLRINQMLLDSRVDLEAGFDLETDGYAPNIETTEDYMHNGGFINTRRGGRSGDGSFYNHGLSSELGVDTSEMLPEESLQASTPKQFPSIRTEGTFQHGSVRHPQSPPVLQVPFPSPEKRQTRGSTSGNSGGSPLKLFGPYDTFTNQTLLRRISQFEEDMSRSTSRHSTNPSQGHHLGGQSTNQSAPDSGSPIPHPPLEQVLPIRSRTVSRFGEGELDEYEFSGDMSYASNEPSNVSGGENWSPILPTAPHFEDLTSSPDQYSGLHVRRRRDRSMSSGTNRHSSHGSVSRPRLKSINLPVGRPGSAWTPDRDISAEGKRPRTSPSKDPTPKRRRTLHQSDIAFGREEQLIGIESADQIHHVGRKRKDARPGAFELAHPDVLATRSILRPRTPTPSQRSSQQREHHPFQEASYAHSPGRQKKSPARPKQNENEPISNSPQGEGDRKPSIRTQDFVDQAAQIMAMIRNQVRAPGLASLEESELELGPVSPGELADKSCQESTNEPFSRPPSREGNLVTWMPPRQENPDLVDRLKQYQELSDMGDVVSSSVRSMGLAKDAIRVTQEVERRVEGSTRSYSDGPLVTEGDIISDLPNVRLSANPAAPGSLSRDFHSMSSGQSSHRTYPSASSRGSDSRRTIMPESVSHLIPDRVGSMYLDKQKNIWIKKKDITPTPKADLPPSDDSEDDPFASIPDLSVDMTKEIQNLRSTRQKETLQPGDNDQESLSISVASQKQPQNRGFVTLSPDAQLSPHIAAITRGEFDKLDSLAMVDEEDAENAAEVDDGKRKYSTSSRRRNLTISFSSPIASIIQDVVAEDLDSLDDDPQRGGEVSSPELSPNRSPRQASAARPAVKNAGQGSLRNNSHIPSRQPSGRGSTFVRRPVSRIDEQDEDSTIEMPPQDERQLSIIGDNSLVSHKTPKDRHVSLSFMINRTPGSTAVAKQADESAMIGRNVGKLSLSPLSEFTLNNSDQSFGFEVSYVMGPRHMATGDGSKRVMSMTIRELVDKLSEVEPFEPYWEDITELDLQNKRLTSLHMLDEFCGKVVTLDASNNTLGQLEGIPSCVRQLKVSHNMLTELTSWDHLMNLQYVDISGNEVKSLSALKNLVHLRSVRADSNQLTSLDGLDTHDGLLSLRARDNLIEAVDFASLRLDRLNELDLAGNKMHSIRNLEALPLLSRLNVSRNRLSKLAIKGTMKTLRQLDVNDNDFTSLDIGHLPNLHSLHADRNRIHELSGFGRVRRLDSLSLREQQGEDALNLDFLASAYEIRKLFLSGNYLGSFAPKVDLLNLQLLELANCGLVTLPDKLGQLMPNLRTLNLNMNGVSDLGALQFIPRLKKLLVAGNRLADSTAVTQLLIDFPHLTQVDLRDNPVTLGFYPPGQVLVATDGTDCADKFTLPAADVERDEKFASRLDEATRLRRRLHHVVLVASCKRLRMLDGLPMVRREVLARDGLVQTLIAEGLLPDTEDTVVGDVDAPRKEEAATDAARDERAAEDDLPLSADAGVQDDERLDSSRWNAEDSFA